MKYMNIPKIILALCLLASFTGCRKNVDQIEETTEDITPFMRITLNGEINEYEPFAAECQGDMLHKLGVSNTALLLQNTFDWSTIENGDFLFEVQSFDSNPSFGFTYKLEGNYILGLIPESDFILENDGEIFSGEVSGNLINLDNNLVQGSFSIEFRSIISYDQNFCE